MIWFAVDKDGTEKASNQVMVRRKQTCCFLWKKFIGRYTKNNWNKWCNTWSSSDKDCLPFTGVILPKGSIEKLTGQKLTWNDEPIAFKTSKICEFY